MLQPTAHLISVTHFFPQDANQGSGSRAVTANLPLPPPCKTHQTRADIDIHLLISRSGRVGVHFPKCQTVSFKAARLERERKKKVPNMLMSCFVDASALDAPAWRPPTVRKCALPTFQHLLPHCFTGCEGWMRLSARRRVAPDLEDVGPPSHIISRPRAATFLRHRTTPSVRCLGPKPHTLRASTTF